MKKTLALLAVIMLSLLITALPSFSVSEMYNFQVSSGFPRYVDFILNCKSDIKIEILRSNAGGVPTGDPAVRTQIFLNQPKGQWKPISGGSYSWNGLDDYGNPAQNGYYVYRVTATNVGTGPIDPLTSRPSYQLDTFPMLPTETVPDPGPGYRGAFMTKPALNEAGYRNSDNTLNFNTTGSVCWMGMAINKKKTSPYYGWMYVGNTVGAVGVKTVYIYGPDGAYKGKLPDPQLTAYGASAPYGIAIAGDDYIYVYDRSTMKIHCYSPAGYDNNGTPGDVSDDEYGTWVSASPTLNNFVGGNVANYDAATGRTFVYGQQSSNPGTTSTYSFTSKAYQCILESNHTTWGAGGTAAIVRSPENVYSDGLYVTPDNLTMYHTSSTVNTGAAPPCDWRGIQRKSRATNTGTFTFTAGDTWGTAGARSIYTGGTLVKEDWERLTFTGLAGGAWQELAGPPAVLYTWKLTIGAFSTPDLAYQISDADLKTALNDLFAATGESFRVVDCDHTGDGIAAPYVRRWTYGVPPAATPAITYSDTSPDSAADASFFVSTTPGDKQIACHDGTYVGGDLSTRLVKDIQLSADGTFFWVGTGADAITPNLYKVDVATGCIIEPGKTAPGSGDRKTNNIAPDAVGNFGMTWGNTSGTPAAQGIWFGVMDWGVKTDTVKLSTIVSPPEPDAPPVLVPGSVQWTVNPLTPDAMQTTDVAFKVLDGNGWEDIDSIVLDLKELMHTGLPTTRSAWIERDAGDPSGRTAVATVDNITAVPGTRPGVRSINATFYDVHDGMHSHSTFQLTVFGNPLNATVEHTRSLTTISGATVTAVGGIPGVWGYPNTYTTVADAAGLASMTISEGVHTLTATKTGYKTLPIQEVTSGGYPSVNNETVFLGPLSIAEAKALGSGYCSLEGVVYAQPQGGVHSGAFVPGMGSRVFSMPSNNLENQSLYIVDPSDPARLGLMVQLAKTRTNYGTTASPIYRTKQWDDPTELDTTMISTFIGKRPADGETICVSGQLSAGSGSAYERALEIDSASLETASPSLYPQWYLNLTDKGVVPLVTWLTPVTVTLPDVTRSTADTSQYGKYARVNNVKVLEWRPNSLVRFYDGTSSTDPVDYVIVQDVNGATAPIAFTTRQSLGLPTDVCPVTIGGCYNFSGAIGKLMKYDQGTIRVMGTQGIEPGFCPPLPDPDPIGSIRGQDTGSTTRVHGIVTKKTDTYFYIESSDRSAAVKVTVPSGASLSAVVQGYDVAASGIITADPTTGIRYIASEPQKIDRVGTMTYPLTVVNLGMRHHDVGGKDCQKDKGITKGRGPLNVGLYVTVMGTVTSRDSTGNFYIWDGSNAGDSTPLEDGSGNRGLRIAHNGWMAVGSGQVPNVARALVPYQDFVSVKGVVEGMKIGDNVVPVINPISVNVICELNISDDGVALLPGDNLFSLPGIPAKIGAGEIPDYYGRVNLYP